MPETARAITLVAIDCAYHELVIQALHRSAAALPVARTLLLTDREMDVAGIEVQQIPSIRSRDAYSRFVLKDLASYIETDYALVIQWDGFVIDGSAWTEEFWNYDYIGAKWAHLKGEFRVGNGGFSLRSGRLLKALSDLNYTLLNGENEDEAIGLRLRDELETRYGIVYADERVADRFAFDVGRPLGRTLGFHGVFNFWRVLSHDELLAFAEKAPETIIKGMGFGALIKNLTDLKRSATARELIARRLALLPLDGPTQALAVQIDALDKSKIFAAAASTSAASTVVAPASRNDLCPCGSGKRYKECHGKISASTNSSAPMFDVGSLLDEALRLHQSGNVQAAIERYVRVLQAEPENPVALHFVGLSQYQSGQPSAAMETMWLSLLAAPNEAEFFSNYSTAAFSAGRYDEGRWAGEQALNINPKHVGALNNLGFNLRMLGQISAAAECYDRALTLLPNDAQTRWNRCFVSLQQGDYQNGFADYELRLQFPQTQPSGRIPVNVPMWRGDAISGQRLLLLCEQGLGDTFMFARFVPMVMALGAQVTLAVQRSQVALMQCSFPQLRVLAVGDHEHETFDQWAALWSLPASLDISENNLPTPSRFLQTRAEDVSAWKARLQAIDGNTRRRIGIVWQGQFAGTDNQMAERSIPLRAIAALIARHPDITWVSLQHGVPPINLPTVVDWTSETVEFTQMAALIDALDIVISIDTSAAHLAAALGAETWVLLRQAGDWRYGIDGSQCLWSPSMRLFRQDASRRWQSVLEAVSEAIKA